MRINAIGTNVPRLAYNSVDKVSNKTEQPAFAGKFKVLSLSEFAKTNSVSFTGKTRNKSQAIFVGAESDPWSKAGGVGTVMKDYRSMLDSKDAVEITPYYGAETDKDTGAVTPKKNKAGAYILPTSKGDIELDLVKEDIMQWGTEKDTKIMLFTPKGEGNKDSYFVFTDAVAPMSKPYQQLKKNNGAYAYASGAKSETNGWEGDPYAKFSKAVVTLLPDIINDKPNFDPATIVCSDSQTAYVQEYMAQNSVDTSDENPYYGIKPTYVGHNLGPGYCGETSKQNMFVNLGATPEQIKEIQQDPLYKEKGDDYFTELVKPVIDETGAASAVMIPIHYAQSGYSPIFTTVAEEYAQNLADNPQAAHNIHNNLKELHKKGSFDGILNALNDTTVDPTKELPNARYNEDCTDTDGTVYPKFEVYPENPTYEQMKEVKNGNKAKLLKRLSAKDNTIVTGNPNRTANINPEAPKGYEGPVIKPELIKMVEEGKGDQVPVFVSWGRIDTQKGHDITLSAFEKFAKTEEGKNAILILGAGLDNGAESKIVEEKIGELLKDPDLQGRIVHIDGWAPAYALASAADAAIFSSRFEPCGLTDLEAMKYYCTPVVANTQGFKQKNFDPRNPNEADIATSFKTTHEFNLLKTQVEPIIKAYVDGDEGALKQVKKEFPIFWTTDSEGNKVYDDTVFKNFAKSYKEYVDPIAKEVGKNTEKYKELTDWDTLSKDYNFKFNGFARELKDGILSAEMADAIGALATSDSDTKEKIFGNLKNLDTSWYGNGTLHPSKDSSADMYIKKHMQPDYEEIKEGDILKASDEKLKGKIEKEQKADIEKRAGAFSMAAITGALGVILGRTKQQVTSPELLKELEELRGKVANTDALAAEISELKTKVADTNALKETIKDLTNKVSTLTKNKNKTVAIAVAASVAATALVTYLATKFIANKKAPKIEENVVVPTTAEPVPAAPTPAPAPAPAPAQVQTPAPAPQTVTPVPQPQPAPQAQPVQQPGLSQATLNSLQNVKPVQ